MGVELDLVIGGRLDHQPIARVVDTPHDHVTHAQRRIGFGQFDGKPCGSRIDLDHPHIISRQHLGRRHRHKGTGYSLFDQIGRFGFGVHVGDAVAAQRRRI
ncbi:hypothetical protein D3C84_694750 [compost metagenome]